MKKIILTILLLIPVLANAETCEIVKDNQTNNDRNLVCDLNNRTTTKFETTNPIKVLENSVCTVTCTENIVLSIDPVKKVLAGMSFNYPLYISGERKCKAVYNYNEYETKIKRLVNEYASLTGTAKQTKANEITNYYAEKKSCDEFSKEGSTFNNKYEYNGDVLLKVETSTKVVDVPYVYKEISDYDSISILDEVNYYNACKYNETSKTCAGSNKTIAGWTETVRTYGKYTMKDVYLEDYTGEIKDVSDDKTCNAGDRFFVDLNELTRPVKNDTTDKGYSLTLIAKNLGNNLSLSGNKWNLNVDCWYQVKNLMFPQNNIGGNTDENYEEYGGSAFEYRIIDLNNPFPGRNPGANWVGKQNIIDFTKDRLSTLQRFIINLNRSSINRVREYNDVHSYDTFNLDEMEKSPFIEANKNIVDRK